MHTVRAYDFADSSYGYVFNSLLGALRNEGVDFTSKVERIFGKPDLLFGPIDWCINNSAGVSEKTVAFVMHESTRMPDDWIRFLNSLKAVIVPSYWCASCFSAQGVTVPIRVCHFGHDFSGLAKKVFCGEGPIIFATVITDCGVGNTRKALSTILGAFEKIHARHENTELWVRSSSSGSSRKGIHFFAAVGTRDAYYNWINSVSCGVFISRGEGFGLAPLEFAATGRPVIGTLHPPLTELVPIPQLLAVESQLQVPVGRSSYLGHWFDPSEEGLIVALENACVFPDLLTLYGELCAVTTRNYTWKASGARLKTILKELL